MMFDLKNGSKKLKKGITYLSLLTLLTPLALQTQKVFAEEVTDSSNISTTTEESSKEIVEQESTETSEIELEKNTIELPSLTSSTDELPIITGNEIKGMYTIGQTSDGRIIQAAGVKKNTMFRSAGNIQGDVIRITIAGVLYEGIKIIIDGQGALCIDQNLRAPFESNVPYDNGVPYENIGVKAILAHGAYGPNNPNPTDEEILLTEIALRNWLTGKLTPNEAVSNSHPYVANLISKAQAGDYFDKKISFSDKSVEATVIGKEQVSKEIKVSGDPDNHVSIPVPSGVTLTNVTTGVKVSNGTAKVYGGQSFKMSAPLNYNEKYSSGKVKSAYGAYTALMFTPFDAGYQRLMQGKFGDPLEVEGFSVNFFARQGKFKLKKTSEISNLPMGAVGFKVTMSTGEVLELETNEKGETPVSKDYDFGTTGEVTEVKTPAGYVQLENPINFTIEAGTTIEVAIENKIQKGKFTFQKFEEVYNPQETWDSGKPMYDRNPAANREFDLVRVNDHTLPDGKTIVGKAGEVVDHVVTDKDGNGSSNVELFIGDQNKYKLVETNTPENYRDPSDVQTEFSIPYGKNTEKLVLFDQGEIDNELKTANITFNKKNALNLDGLNIAGAEFLVEGITNDVKFMFTTENEAALLKLLADKGTATYKFTEIKRPNGFEQVPGETDTRIVTVTDGQDLTIDWENMPKIEEPKMGTQAYANNGGKDFDRTIDNDFYDKIKYENFDGNKYLVTKVVGVKTGKVYAEFEGELVSDKATGEKVVKTTIPANTIGEEDVRFVETAYNDKTKKEVYVDHDDPNDKEQTLYYKAKETPATPKKTTTPTKTSTLPTTGEVAQSVLMMVGFMVVAIASLIVFSKKTYELD